jgi:hypothetical protein
MAGFLYTAYRNSVVGVTAVYSTRVDADTDTLAAYFNDDGTVAPAIGDNFATTYDTSLNSMGGNWYAEPLASVTAGVVASGVVDAADSVFTGASALAGSTSVESLIVSKNIGNATATSPNLAHWDSANATGLPLTPNGADVTVVWHANGQWRF